MGKCYLRLLLDRYYQNIYFQSYNLIWKNLEEIYLLIPNNAQQDISQNYAPPHPPVPPHFHQKYSVFNFSFTLSPGADCLQTLRVNPANWRIPLGAKNLFIFFRTKKIPIQISIHTIIFTHPPPPPPHPLWKVSFSTHQVAIFMY